MKELIPGQVCPWPPVPRNEETGFFRGERPRVFSPTRMDYPPSPGRPKGSKSGRRVDISGQEFGRLTVLERVDDHITPSGKAHPNYLCRCECGVEKTVLGHNLTSWKTVSCGNHEKWAPGPGERKKPRGWYVARNKAIELKNFGPILELEKAWELYENGKGPKPLGLVGDWSEGSDALATPGPRPKGELVMFR